MTLHQLVKIRPEENQRRFYAVSVMPGLFGNWAVQREYGRIGQAGQLRREWFESEEGARREAEKLLQAKVKRGYQAAANLGLRLYE